MREGNKAVFTPFSIFPLENDPIPQGYDGWMLLLDELSSANKQVQAAAYKLILDRQVGSFNLHPNCAIVAAGNKITDKAVVTQMSTALQSRLIHYELSVSVDDLHEKRTTVINTKRKNCILELFIVKMFLCYIMARYN